MASRMSRILGAYQHQLTHRPILAGAITSGTLFGLGDIISQQAIERKGVKKHDWLATGRMAFYGGAIFGPAASGWYKLLEKYVVVKRSVNLQMAARVAADQLLFAPVAIATFFSVMAGLEMVDPVEKLNNNWWVALRANWNIWPAVQVINFRFVPLQLRIVFVNVVSVGWNTYLAWLNSQKLPMPTEEEAHHLSPVFRVDKSG